MKNSYILLTCIFVFALTIEAQNSIDSIDINRAKDLAVCHFDTMAVPPSDYIIYTANNHYLLIYERNNHYQECYYRYAVGEENPFTEPRKVIEKIKKRSDIYKLFHTKTKCDPGKSFLSDSSILKKYDLIPYYEPNVYFVMYKANEKVCEYHHPAYWRTPPRGVKRKLEIPSLFKESLPLMEKMMRMTLMPMGQYFYFGKNRWFEYK